MKSQCPGCGCTSLPSPWILPSQPVILNYRFATANDAQKVPRRDMHLMECPECGLIFNASLDETIIPYDENYDNRQGFSPAFTEHLNQTIHHLAEHYPVRDGTILEVGCGKGDFLKHLCRETGSRGLGFDTTCEIEGPGEADTHFFRRYSTELDVPGKVNAIICRHVVEHVSAIGDFFNLLYKMALAGNVDVTYVETPVWEWIAKHQAIWDVFYEHCNYFKFSTLRNLAERAGFVVLNHRLVFGGQYQALYLGLSETVRNTTPLEEDPSTSLSAFQESFQTSMESLKQRLQQEPGRHPWAIWGAGAKGVTLANHLGDLNPTLVIDSNPGKWGNFIPGTSIPTVPPTSDNLSSIQLILIANPNYEAEISDTLSHLGLRPHLLSA